MDTWDFFREQRSRMVEEQLRSRGICDPRVIEAMSAVPREEFVPYDVRELAYRDSPLPIGYGQTISQPYTVAFMCEALKLNGCEKVLEVGTGSGYGAAVLSCLAREVYSVERIVMLAEAAEARLSQLGYSNVCVRIADGSLGLPGKAPFDAIMVTAGAKDLPRAYVEQLADGGRIVIPVGRIAHLQTLFRFTLRGGKITTDWLGGFSFVPLVGRYGWATDQGEFNEGEEQDLLGNRASSSRSWRGGRNSS